MSAKKKKKGAEAPAGAISVAAHPRAAGIVGNLAGRACAIAVWRSLIMAEVKAAREAHRARVERASQLVETERRTRADKAATA